MNEIIEEIKKFVKDKYLNRNFDDCFPKFPSVGYEPIKISKENFHPIKINDSNKKIAFIDGGNQEIFGSVDFSLSLIRVYYNIFENNKKISSKLIEFFALVYTENVEDELYYNTKIFDENNKGLIDEKVCSYSVNDKSIKSGSHNAEISKIPSIIRRFSEIQIANSIVNQLDSEDIIVLDGTMEASITNEKVLLDELYDKASKKNVVISALAKKSSLYTDRGMSITNYLSSLQPEGMWNYFPLAKITNENHIVEMHFVKLHKKSEFVFRFEVYNKQIEYVNDILSILVMNSKDPVFLGYPYGLIDADKFARVTNNEISYYKTLIKSKIPKLNDILSKRENAHSILDNISF